MYQLNFDAEYRAPILAGEKRLSVRRGCGRPLRVGDAVALTVTETVPRVFAQARIVALDCRPLGSLLDVELDDESPDCRTLAALRRVLANIYGRTLGDDEPVSLIRFELSAP